MQTSCSFSYVSVRLLIGNPWRPNLNVTMVRIIFVVVVLLFCFGRDEPLRDRVRERERERERERVAVAKFYNTRTLKTFLDEKTQQQKYKTKNQIIVHIELQSILHIFVNICSSSSCGSDYDKMSNIMGFIVKSFVYKHLSSSVLQKCKHVKPKIRSLYMHI